VEWGETRQFYPHGSSAQRARRETEREFSQGFFFLLWLNYFFEVAKNGFYSFSSRQILKRIKKFL